MTRRFPKGSLGWAAQHAQWRALGIAKQDIDKPKIAVVNTSSGLSICYAHLDEISGIVQQAIRAAGGLPFEVRTSAPSDGLSFAVGRREALLTAREVMVEDVVLMVGAAALDGMVLLSSCDTTTPAHLIAAVSICRRSCCPAAIRRRGDRSANIFDVYEGVGAVAAGRLSADELEEIVDVAIACPGVCGGLGTANTMHILAEALGLALPGGAPIRGDSEVLREQAERIGRRIVALVEQGITAGRLITREAIENALMVLLALGGATTCVGHLAALAEPAGIELDVLRWIETEGDRIPRLCAVMPNGADGLDDLVAAGGALALMKRLEDQLNPEVVNVAGVFLPTLLRDAVVADSEVIRSLDAPAAEKPGLIVLRGGLAPAGALARPGIVPEALRRFGGPARRLADAEAAFAALADGTIRSGEVLVLGQGIDDFACALAGAGLTDSVAVVSEGGFSGLSKGLCVGHVRPGIADGGPLGDVADGDPIRIDLDAHRIDRGDAE